MVNIARTHTRRNSIGGSLSPKASELGEVDTKAPFQSVKDALSLFGVPSSSPPHVKPVFNKKSKPQPQPQPQPQPKSQPEIHSHPQPKSCRHNLQPLTYSPPSLGLEDHFWRS